MSDFGVRMLHESVQISECSMRQVTPVDAVDVTVRRMKVKRPERDWMMGNEARVIRGPLNNRSYNSTSSGRLRSTIRLVGGLL